jgi:NADPH-dependent curcumin reductase CurA
VEGDDRASDGLAHLQAAAREAIAAARAFLDVAEDLVGDPAAVSAIADAVGSVVRTAARRGREATGATTDDGHVEHIPVS